MSSGFLASRWPPMFAHRNRDKFRARCRVQGKVRRRSSKWISASLASGILGSGCAHVMHGNLRVGGATEAGQSGFAGRVNIGPSPGISMSRSDHLNTNINNWVISATSTNASRKIRKGIM
jgi:hypothetical protein